MQITDFQSKIEKS